MLLQTSRCPRLLMAERYVHGPHGSMKVGFFDTAADLNKLLREGRQTFSSSSGAFNAEAPARGSVQGKATDSSKASAQEDFSKQFAANLQRRLGSKKEAPAETISAAAQVPSRSSTPGSNSAGPASIVTACSTCAKPAACAQESSSKQWSCGC